MIVGRRWSNWCENNSFDNLIKYLVDCQVVSTDNLTKWDHRVLRYIRNRTSNSCYSSMSFMLELEALKQAIFKPPKIVHFWIGDNDYYYSYWIRRITKAKVVVNLFFSIEELEQRMPNKIHLNKADLVTCSGLKQLEYLSKFISEDKLAYLPLCVDTNFFIPSTAIKSINHPRLLQVGFNRRNFVLLKKVYLQLKSHLPDLNLDMVVGKDEVAKDFLNLDDVNFYPFLQKSELKSIYQKADLLILPLNEGGSSQSLNEALACGLPVVTNDYPFLSDYTNTDAVIKCEPNNIDQMVNSCLEVLKNKDLKYKMSISARKYALQFDYNNIYKCLLDIYRQYLGYNILINN